MLQFLLGILLVLNLEASFGQDNKFKDLKYIFVDG